MGSASMAVGVLRVWKIYGVDKSEKDNIKKTLRLEVKKIQATGGHIHTYARSGPSHHRDLVHV